jgi:hypothetical protein
MSDGIDLSEKLSTFAEHWSPRTVTQFNDCDVMVVKVKGGTSTITRTISFSC